MKCQIICHSNGKYNFFDYRKSEFTLSKPVCKDVAIENIKAYSPDSSDEQIKVRLNRAIQKGCSVAGKDTLQELIIGKLFKGGKQMSLNEVVDQYLSY